MPAKEIAFLFKHSSIYGFGTILSQLVGFIMLPLYTRYLTPKDYGLLNLIELSTFLLGMVVTTGIAQTLSRFYYDHECTKERNRIVSTMYITYILLSVILLPLLLLSTSLLSEVVLDSIEYATYFQISFISFMLGGLLDIGLVYLRVTEKSIYFVIISATRLFMLLSLNVYFIVVLKLGILGIFYSGLVTALFYQMVMTVPILIKVKPRFSLKYCTSMLRFSVPLIPAQLANTFINQSDRYFIRYFISIADTGIYSLAQKLGTALHYMITCSFQSAFEPKRFEIVRTPDARATFNTIFLYHIGLLVFLGLAISLFIPDILRVMVTPEFYRAGQLVPLIVLSAILLGFRNHFEFGILWSKNTKYYAYANTIMSLFNLFSNFIFIATMGLWGAVYSSTLTIILHNILIYHFGKKYYIIKYDFLRVGKLLGIAIFLYGISLILKTNHIIMDTFLKSILLPAFVFGLFWTKVITPSGTSAFKDLLLTRIISTVKSWTEKIKVYNPPPLR